MNILYEDAALVVLDKPAGLSSEEGVPAALRQLWGPAGCLCGGGAPAGHRCVRPDGVCQNARGCGRTQPSDHPEPGTPTLCRMAGPKGSRKRRSSSSGTGRHCRRAGRSTARRRHPAELAVQGQPQGPGVPGQPPAQGVREAVLEYRIVTTAGEMSLAEITLHTGRTHQIRVQFASPEAPAGRRRQIRQPRKGQHCPAKLRPAVCAPGHRQSPWPFRCPCPTRRKPFEEECFSIR